jgi:MFS family permease
VNHKITTLVLAGAAHGLVHLLMLSLPYITVKLLQVTPILPGQEALIVILLNTPSYFIFGLSAIPAGVLCDRIGPTKTIAIGLFLSVCSGIGLFFFWPLGIGTIAIFFILYSFGAGLYHPAGTTWVSNTFPKNRGKALGRHGIGGSIGQASAPIISALILSTIFWPAIFLVLALIAFIVALVILRAHITPADEPEPQQSHVKPSKNFFAAMTPLIFVFMSLLLITRGMLYRGTVTILPTYITLELQALLVLAGLFGTLVYVGGAVGQEIGGRLTDKIGWQRTLFVMCILSGIALLLLSIPYTPAFTSDLLLVVSVVFFGFSFFSAQAATNTMVASLSTTANRGSVFGWSFFARFGMGAFGITIAGLLQVLSGTWVLGFIAMAVLGLTAALFVPLIHPRLENKGSK